mmetsp:Transcript_6582/g.8243  ORF Transcript_6582/g.8243 Transcript_6582/m.8243 type:complete len:395 (-) Transcript_6582:537-1721(-)
MLLQCLLCLILIFILLYIINLIFIIFLVFHIVCLLRKLTYHIQHLPHQLLLDHTNYLTLLQRFTIHIQRQILRIYHTLNKPIQVFGKQLKIVRNHYSLHIQLHSRLPLINIPSTRLNFCRDALRKVHKSFEIHVTLSVKMRPFRWLLVIMRYHLVKLLVFLVTNHILVTIPNRLVSIHLLHRISCYCLHLLLLLFFLLIFFIFHFQILLILILLLLLFISILFHRHLHLLRKPYLYWMINEFTVMFYQLLNLITITIIHCILLQKQCYLRSPTQCIPPWILIYQKITLTILRLPYVLHIIFMTLTRHSHPIRHQKRRIKTHTKLTNHAHIRLTLRHRLHETSRARPCHRTQIAHQLRLRHTNTTIRNSYTLLRLVVLNVYLQLLLLVQYAGILN